MKNYYTVVIPWSVTPTVWHPTENTGPFSTLTRGVFDSEQVAHDWAKEHLGHAPVYSLRFVDNARVLAEERK